MKYPIKRVAHLNEELDKSMIEKATSLGLSISAYIRGLIIKDKQ